MKKQFYFTDRQMAQINHAVHYTKYLFDFERCIPSNVENIPEMKSASKSMRAASNILIKEITKEKKRREKLKNIRVKK
jgi:hypothetical protein